MQYVMQLGSTQRLERPSDNPRSVFLHQVLEQGPLDAHHLVAVTKKLDSTQIQERKTHSESRNAREHT